MTSPLYALLLSSVGLALAGPVAAQSFDCTRASTAVEHAICSDAGLAELDEHLGTYYAAADIALGEGRGCLQRDQRDWLRTVRDACGPDTTCLGSAYLERLSTLDGLQPGATAVRDRALPPVPVLITALPAESEVAEPTAAIPLILEGVLDLEAADPAAMGVVIRQHEGEA